MQHNQHIVNDPVYGFISIPRGLLLEIIAHPYFQRLDRVRQLGLSSVVYPGAQHTRKQHSLGAYHLMTEALQTLAAKGEFIFDSEAEAAQAAILMHDLGHAPFSHVLEDTLTRGMGHEEISLLMMERINQDLRGELALAISIFRDKHPKKFLHELICSQLDMDRLDYLCRDSFYTGVREGNIGAARIIKMLNVADGHLVVDAKGIYSVENYLLARRLMYWQVYLHKTAVAAECMLRHALLRAKHLAMTGTELFASPALRYFLYNDVSAAHFHAETEECLKHYAALDDSDILSALKVWSEGSDKVLSRLCSDFIGRRLFRAEMFEGEVPEEEVEQRRRQVAHAMGISADEARSFVEVKRVAKEMYSATTEGIRLLYPDGTVHDVAAASHIVNADTPVATDCKHYLLSLRTDN
ncbi:MAG: HD domain-containing protein [Bacteroidaceae bacterium]|nr:HD domain-containing protein [Bacteroidaceae bacterium]